MTSLLFVNGQVRALEHKLLDVNRLDRMIGASSPEDAFRVLVELQYAEYFDDSVQAQDFAKIITQGLEETKKLLIEGTGNHPGLGMLWYEFDLNNIKRALKLKHLEAAESLGKFSEKEGFSSLGNITAEDLDSAVFHQRFADDFPEEFIEIIKNTESLLATKKHFRFVEFACDQAYFDLLSRIFSGIKDPFLDDLLALKADMTNLRMMARSLLVIEEPLEEAAFLSYGRLDWSEVHQIETFADFVGLVKRTSFWALSGQIEADKSPEENIHALEKALDHQYHQFIRQAQEGETDSLAVAIHYIERRLQNARLLKFVMFAKFHGLDPKVIYKTLEQF